METITRKEAIAKGQAWFFTGEPCKNGHIAKKGVKRWNCYECTNAFKKDILIKNGDKIRMQKRESYKRNFDTIAKKVKEKYPEIKEERKKYLREYYLKNKDELKRKAADYSNTEKGRIVKKNTSNRRRSQTKKGDVTSLQLLELQQNAKTCYWCNKPLKNKIVHIDHYVALSKGGEHTLSNLVISCQSCNNMKGAKDPIEFAVANGKLL